MAVPKPKEPKTCERPGCGKQFIPARSDQKFCCSTCKGRYQAYKPVLERRR